MGLQMETLNEYKVNDMGTENNGCRFYSLYLFLFINSFCIFYLLFIHIFLFISKPSWSDLPLRSPGGPRFAFFSSLFIFFFPYICMYTRIHMNEFTIAHTHIHTRTQDRTYTWKLRVCSHTWKVDSHAHIIVYLYTLIHTFIARIRGYSSLSHSLTHIVRVRKYMMHHIYLHMHTPMRTYIYVRLCFYLFIIIFFC